MDDPLAHLLDAGLDLSRERRYVVERELGRGSMGVVFAGRDLLLDRPVAIKLMAGSMVSDADLRRYFEREARAAGRLAHRNVVTVHDFGYDARGYPYVVMELLRGRDLRQVAIASVPLAIDRRLAIVLQILAGLAHAHASGVVHRDVKPANVFITDDGVVKLLDFGIARLTQGSRGSSDAVMGTTDYMSPEQVLGGEVDGRSDLFGCGVLLFELLAGAPPFHAESFVTIAYRVVHEEPDYSLLPVSCRSLEPVLRKALAKSRDDRYPSATDFATDIGLAMGVGVAPETIQPAPAWTIPLPRLVPVREAAASTAGRQPWEETAMGTPDHSPVRPRWPLHAHEDDDHQHPRRRPGRRRARMAWAAAGACAAVAAFVVGMARWRAAAPPVASAAVEPTVAPPTPVAAEVAPAIDASAQPPVAPSDSATPLPEDESAGASPSPEVAEAERPSPVAPRPVVVVSSAPFWTIPSKASPSPSPATGSAAATPLGAIPTASMPTPIPPTPLPARIINGRWTGFVTDDFCREKGAVSDHGQCLETCLRRGRQPLILVDGQLYRLVNFDRIRGQHEKAVIVEGQLDVERRVLIVTSGSPVR